MIPGKLFDLVEGIKNFYKESYGSPFNDKQLKNIIRKPAGGDEGDDP
jgi:hypothetical protein